MKLLRGRFAKRIIVVSLLLLCNILAFNRIRDVSLDDIIKNTNEWKKLLSKKFEKFLNYLLIADNDERSCNYITFVDIGHTRLGNQMFQYASLYGLAKMNKKKPFLQNADFSLRKIFNLSMEYFNQSLEDFQLDRETDGCCTFVENSTRMSCDKNVTMDGFRQSYKYFDKYTDEIKKEYSLQYHLSSWCDKVFEDILTRLYGNLTRNCFLVGAHMRRGDFVIDSYQYKGYVPAESSYLRKAIRLFERRFAKKYGCVRFLIVGDDKNWNLINSPKKYNVLVLETYLSPPTDLCILSRCNGTIVSTGSFGWWAAYLAGGPTTYMKNQCRPNSTLCDEIDMRDYIKPSWDWTPL